MNSKTVKLLRHYSGAFRINFKKLKREYQKLPRDTRFEHKQRVREELKM